MTIETVTGETPELLVEEAPIERHFELSLREPIGASAFFGGPRPVLGAYSTEEPSSWHRQVTSHIRVPVLGYADRDENQESALVLRSAVLGAIGLRDGEVPVPDSTVIGDWVLARRSDIRG